jgi:hypothetical protein
MQTDTGQETFTRLIAEASIKVAALRTGGRNAHAEAIFAADHAIEKLLPFHVLRVAARKQSKMTLHQLRQFAAVGESKVLPKMVGPRRSARNQQRHQRVEWGRRSPKAPQQLSQAQLIFADGWLGIQSKTFQPPQDTWEVAFQMGAQRWAADANCVRE